jgi:molybdopterin-guanine dinucleotide biosynthesis protein
MKEDLFTELKRFGVFGSSESGKSTLAIYISQQIFRNEKRPSIVLSPNDQDGMTKWGKHARVYRNEKQFWKFALEDTKDCLIIADDASETIAADKELTNVFTSMRHRGHKLLVIGHRFNDLTPKMRGSIQRVFLFKQDPESCDQWSKQFSGADLSPAMYLPQYSCLTVANYKPVILFKTKPL